AGQCGFLFAFLCPMVRDGKEKAGGDPGVVLVSEPDGFLIAADLFAAPGGQGDYFRVCVSVDPLHPEPGHSFSPQGSAPGLSGVRLIVSAASEILRGVRHQAGGRETECFAGTVSYFFGAAIGAAMGALVLTLYLERILAWKSGCVRPKSSNFEKAAFALASSCCSSLVASSARGWMASNSTEARRACKPR